MSTFVNFFVLLKILESRLVQLRHLKSLCMIFRPYNYVLRRYLVGPRRKVNNHLALYKPGSNFLWLNDSECCAIKELCSPVLAEFESMHMSSAVM